MANMVLNITQSTYVSCPDGCQRGQAQEQPAPCGRPLETILPTAVAEISCSGGTLIGSLNLPNVAWSKKCEIIAPSDHRLMT
jgi:hypothetical protein